MQNVEEEREELAAHQTRLLLLSIRLERAAMKILASVGKEHEWLTWPASDTIDPPPR